MRTCVANRYLPEQQPGEVFVPQPAVINERARALLKTLVERYISEGQPVGSRTLAKDSGFNLSPATIRNIMSDLEELGLIHAPHTSAGRVPTVQGYRLFVDNLLTVKPLGKAQVEQLKEELDTGSGTEQVLDTASSLLSGITSMAGVVTVPRHQQTILHQVEFLPLSANRVLVILVLNEQDVQNRVIQTARAYSVVELQQAANFINREFAGQDLLTVREGLLHSLKEAREDIQRIMRTAMEVADQVLERQQGDDYVLAGQINLMNYAEMADIDKLRQLFEAFNTKNDILHLMEQSIYAEGIQIFIGGESGHTVLDTCSVISAPYSVDGEVVGVLGVIGPTRMAYDRVIPVVDVTAKLLSAVLTSE